MEDEKRPGSNKIKENQITKLSRFAVASCGTMDICDLLMKLSGLQHTRARACN